MNDTFELARDSFHNFEKLAGRSDTDNADFIYMFCINLFYGCIPS